MANKIYALLVGIDKYHPQSGVGSLTGCVNDIEAIEAYLHKRIATDNDWKVVTQKLTNNRVRFSTSNKSLHRFIWYSQSFNG
jgi:hypothetical protein